MEAKVRNFNVLIERDRDGYLVASVPAIPGCHTQASTTPELLERIREAIELCLEVDSEVEPLELVGVERLSLAG